MPKFTLGIGILLVSVLLALIVGELIKRNAVLQELSEGVKRNQSSSEKQTTDGFDPLALAINKQASSSHYHPDCSKEQYADLCAQLRMADAAEWQAVFTESAFYLLVLTFGAAAWAAWEARSGANAINILHEGIRFGIVCSIRWTDVFGETQAIKTGLMTDKLSEIDGFEKSGNMMRRNFGAEEHPAGQTDS